MKNSIRWWSTAFVALLTLVLVSTSAVVAFQVRPKTSRFDSKVVENPTQSIDVVTTSPSDLPATSSVRTAWEGFRVANGPWTVHLDRRSGAPLLVEGQGIRFPVEPGATVESIGVGLRSFIAANVALLKAEDNELVLDSQGSGQLSPDVWQIVFNREIAGVPVVGERYVFTVGHGNLMSFGAPRWSRIDASPFPTIDAAEARGRLSSYMGIALGDAGVKLVEKGTLQLIPLKTMSMVGRPYDGPVGAGFTSALVWRVAITVDGEPGTWEGLVDAHTGEVRSFNDINDYAQAKGGVYPVSNDGTPPDGVEQANWPMPYANISLGAQTTTSSGLFSCTPGGSVATTTLAGPYVRVIDTCGAVSASVTCDADLSLGASIGTDCVVPSGASPGDTHASRTGFYHLNRIAEHARVWLPTRPWLTAQLTDNVNLNQTCNAYWNGTSVNFFKSGGGCRNTGEIAGVFLHEWGHGLDSNDGGGSDNPSEAYADITAIMSTHVSCVGRGFDMTSNCGGYGDACLNCTGIRDQDFAKHASNTPATPSGFLTTNCGGGAGPCGKEVHCESYVGAETLWDLATRDLPASGLDLASSWQLADKLWYKSRLGSGGNAYNCALPNSDGCAVTSWFSKLRAIDDDDGNLANGTPHAAAIFAAFNRHKIACGLAADASNQSTSGCPAIGATTLTSLAGSNSAQLNWTAVANATAYRILRNDASCDAGSTIVATVAAPTTTYTDSGLANGFPEFYRVQAIGTNQACDGLLSNCQSVTPQPFAGTVKFDRSVYSCSGLINVTVTDGNIAGTTATVAITSGSEPGGETITVTQVSPGSADYAGTINTTSAPAAADGAISVVNGDTITGTYIDADDGIGGVNLTRTTTASADCVFPIISNVHVGAIGGSTAQLLWDTNEAANSSATYGLTPPPGTNGPVDPTLTTSHSYTVSGLSTCTPYVFSVTSADAVGNVASDNNGGTYYGFTTGANVAKNIPYTGAPVAIPDNNPAGGTATINVPDNKVISDVNVTLNNVTHTYDSDVVVHLIGPDNTDVILANHRGSSGDNFTNTVFDDSAATPVASGTAPFTGSFIPDSPLSAFNGKVALGAWKLFIVDSVGQDSGTITSWTLNFTLAQTCAPHATYGSHGLVADTCSGGGPGNANAIWESGEQVQFKVTASSDGTVTLTGVTATVVPITPGVTMLDGTASYPDITGGGSADSLAPHFTAQLPAGLPCGSSVSFQYNVTSNEGSWSSTFTQQIGQVIPGGGNALTETFSAGIPATWTVVDGGVGGLPAAATWTTANPGARPIASPMSAPVAIVDSDNAGNGTGVLQDEELITPLINLTTASSATLQFDQFFKWYSGGMSEIADVDVRSSLTGGAWVNVLRQSGASSPEPDHKTIDITAQAAGAANVQVRFHYYNGHWEWYWQVDNVKVDYVAPGGCNQASCAGPAGVAKPVADGSFGTPMTGSRIDPTTIALMWDVSTCSSTDHHVLYGDLANVSLATVSGSYCNLGTSGSASWSGVPAGDLWFVIVGDDDASKEGSWGLATAGERGGASASGQCGMTTRDNSGTCP